MAHLANVRTSVLLGTLVAAGAVAALLAVRPIAIADLPRALDVHNWSRGVALAVNLAALVMLLAIRFSGGMRRRFVQRRLRATGSEEPDLRDDRDSQAGHEQPRV